MPSFPYTPGILVLTGGEFQPEPVRFTYTAGELTLSGGSFAPGPNLSPGVGTALTAVLDFLFAGEEIVDEHRRPTRRFQQIWENAIGTLKDTVALQGGEIDELQEIYARIDTAQATATAAVQTANATQQQINLADSRTDPVSGVLSAASDGTITIAAHNRVYADGASVAVDGGTVTGQAPGAFVRVYYTDPARSGGAVTYLGTTAEVVQEGETHVVGGVTIPAVGELPASGQPPFPPGFVPDYRELGL